MKALYPHPEPLQPTLHATTPPGDRIPMPDATPPIANKHSRTGLAPRLSAVLQSLLLPLVMLIGVLAGWGEARALPFGTELSASRVVAIAGIASKATETSEPRFGPVLGARSLVTAQFESHLERIAALLREIRPTGSLAPTAAELAARRTVADGLRDPYVIAGEIETAAASLIGMRSAVLDDYQRERTELNSFNIDRSVVDRQSALIAEFEQRINEFEALNRALSSSRTGTDFGEFVTQLTALTDFFTKYQNQRGYAATDVNAIRAQQPDVKTLRTPILFQSAFANLFGSNGRVIDSVRLSDTPLPGATPEPNDSPTPADLAATDEVQLTPAIRAKATELGNNPVLIRNYVYNEIRFLPTHGAAQGSDLTLRNKAGNAFDSNALLIALLRAAQIPARFVYGTIEIPIAEAQNWVGNASSPALAIELLQKGGIPATSVTAAGVIRAVRIEHVWVEAFVDFNVSRGAVNREAHQWTPLDGSFKQYDYVEALTWTNAAQISGSDYRTALLSGAQQGPGNSWTGLNFDAVRTLADRNAVRARDTLLAQHPQPTTEQIRGSRTIVRNERPILEGTLPYLVVSATLARFSALPEVLKWKVSIKLYASLNDLSLEVPSVSTEMPLVKLQGQPLDFGYTANSSADQLTIDNFASANAESMPVAQIAIKPEVRLGAAVLLSAAPTRMGTAQAQRVDVLDGQGRYVPTQPFRFTAGSKAAFVVNPGFIDQDQAIAELEAPGRRAELPIERALQLAGLQFWMLRDQMDQRAAAARKAILLRLPSVAAFAAPLQVSYYFGIPRIGWVQGFATDAKNTRFAAIGPTLDANRRLHIQIGVNGSLNEGLTWDLLRGRTPGSAVSAATVLKRAFEQGIPVHQVDASNVDEVNGMLQVSADVRNDIANAVNAGMTVLVPQREVKIGKWQGSGYVLMDLDTGNAAWMIEGGLHGSIDIDCLIRGVILKALCELKIAHLARNFLNIIDPATWENPTEALAALAEDLLYLAFPVVGAVLQVIELAIAVAQAIAEVTRWVRQIMDGAENLSAEDLAFLGINALNAAICSYAPPCFGGFGGFGGGGGLMGGAGGLGGGHDGPAPGRKRGGGGDDFGFMSGLGGAGNPPPDPSLSPPMGFGAGGPRKGNPVALGYGAKIEEWTDYVGGGPFPLIFERTYTSLLARGTAPIGQKWSASYFAQIRWDTRPDAGAMPSLERPNAVVVQRHDGGYVQFNWRSDRYVTDSNWPEVLTRVYDGNGLTTGWEYRTTTDEVEQYNAIGKLVSISDRVGNTQLLAYNDLNQLISVTDPQGKQLKFVWAGIGQLASMTDPSNRTTSYFYDASQNLVRVEYPDNTYLLYHYEDASQASQLTGITDELGQRLSTFKYDGEGRIIESVRAGGVDRYKLKYVGDSVEVTDPLGTLRTYQYQILFERPYLTAITEPCGSGCGGGGISRITYDARGYAHRVADFNGNVTEYIYDEQGRELERVEAKGSSVARTIKTEWHPDLRLPTRLIEPLAGDAIRITDYNYDSKGSLAGIQVEADGQSRSWSLTTNSAGQLSTLDGPRTDGADIELFTYENGLPKTYRNPNGHIWTYDQYNADGQLLQTTDPNGLITRYAYDQRQRLISETEKDSIGDPGETTLYTYNEAGLISKVTDPDGSFVDYRYDPAQRLVEAEDALHHKIVMTLDGLGNAIKTDTSTAGQLVQTESQVIDALGRAGQAIGANADEITRYEYDPNGNEKRITDPLNHATQHSYDALDRLSATLDALNGRVTYGYDVQDNLTRVEDPRHLVTTYVYNGFNDQTRLVSPDTGTTDYAYDAAGNLKSKTDARNITASYIYDQNNRVRTINYPATTDTPAETLTFNYDESSGGPGAMGNLTSISDGSGHTEYTYDRHGRLTTKTQTVVINGAPLTPKSMSYSYAANGQISQMTMPSGAVVGYSYGADGRVLTVSVNGVEVIREIEYFADGEPKRWTYNIADRYERQFDLNGRIKSHTAGADIRSLTFDAASRIVGISDNRADGNNEWAYGYDELDRLTRAANAATVGPVAGVQLGWSYDPTGNRLTEAKGIGSLPTVPSRLIGIEPTSNRLASIATGGGAPIPRVYDAVGNTITDDEGRSSTYNARNRLAQISRTGVSASYEHNAFGERVSKSSQGQSRQYTYDFQGHLSGEYSDAALVAETVWLGDAPVVVLKHSELAASHGGVLAGSVAIFFVQPDQLGSPRVLVNSSNASVWRWDSAPFGDSPADEQPNGSSSTFGYHLRFPGQQFDGESDLNYNYFRDYEAGVGRYVQSDPIGLRGGSSGTYIYVDAKPLDGVDPVGLVVIGLKIRPGWSKEEKAYGRAKIRCLNRAAKAGLLSKTKPPPRPSTRQLRKLYTGSTGNVVPPNHDMDHVIDLQVNGCANCAGNIRPAPRRVNQSLGSQLNHQLTGLDYGTVINGVERRR